jgi:hypothetical protein
VVQVIGVTGESEEGTGKIGSSLTGKATVPIRHTHKGVKARSKNEGLCLHRGRRGEKGDN